MFARWGGVRELGEKVKRLRSTNCQLQNDHGDVTYSLGNIVNNVITMYGVKWVWTLSGESLPQLYKCPTTRLYI